MGKDSEEGLNDSFLKVREDHSACFRILKKFDVFSFVPFPKNQPVTTKQSLIGSLLFLLIILAFAISDFVAFVTYNPPSIQTYYTKIDDTKQYTIPKFAINFMDGQALNETRNFDDTFRFKLTEEKKAPSKKYSTQVPLNLNAGQNMTWISGQIQEFYQRLFTPGDDMKAQGLLYGSPSTNYSKISIQMCNFSDQSSNQTCLSFEQISSECAKGRIFLFVEIEQDKSILGDLTNYGKNRFKLYNYFLIPLMYKRVIIQLNVVKTVIEPDYFYRFSQDQHQRIEIASMIQQTSNTSINDAEINRTSLDLFSITFQLSGQVENVRASYDNLLDRVAKWGAFANLVFTIFCIIFLAYNRKKFYERHPEWDKFKKEKGRQSHEDLRDDE